MYCYNVSYTQSLSLSKLKYIVNKNAHFNYVYVYTSTESGLFPFGIEVGDTRLSVSVADETSPYIFPPMGFTFMDKLFERLYVSIFFINVTKVIM